MTFSRLPAPGLPGVRRDPRPGELRPDRLREAPLSGRRPACGLRRRAGLLGAGLARPGGAALVRGGRGVRRTALPGRPHAVNGHGRLFVEPCDRTLSVWMNRSTQVLPVTPVCHRSTQVLPIPYTSFPS
jgi:hypothetical protein